MKLPILLFFVCFSLSFAQDNAKAVPVSAINRKELFTAVLGKEKSVSNVKVLEVTMGKKQRAPLHLHPCVTMGVVTEGVITFQIEGQPEQFLKAGDTFFEPENVRIAKFNNESDSTAKFVVFYLLKKEGDFTLQVIEKE